MKTVAKALIAGAGIGIGVAGVFAARKFLSKKLVTFAIDRKEPTNANRRKKKASGGGEHLKALEDMKAMSDKLENSGLETVEITAFDGITLVGHYHKAENPKRVLIAMHGWRSSWCRDFGGIADFWHDNDCSVLYCEQRGQNASGGDYMGFGTVERYDCLEWAKYVNEITEGKLPIYLVGISMGAATVLMTSDLSLPDSVHGIMADCAYTSPRSIWHHVVQNNFHIPYRFVSSDIDKAYRRITQAESTYSCEDSLRNCKVPVLFIHGTADSFVPVRETYKNYMACAAPKELLIVPGANHGMSYLVEKDKYENASKDFWAKYDESKVEN